MSVAKPTQGGRELQIATLQLDGCEDATIGTRVNLGGHLIVNQYLQVDGVSQPAQLNAIKKLLIRDSTKKFSLKNTFSLKILIFSIFLTSVVAGAAVGITLLIKKANKEDDLEELPKNYTDRLHTRAFWSADELNSERKELFYRPAKFVVVAHTQGSDCTKPVVCETLIRGIQQDHLSRSYGDIGYNFLIGGDGYIYEGMGWGRYGAHTFGVNCASIGVAFIGDYTLKRLRPRERDAFRILLEEGVRLGELEPDYKIFAQGEILGGPSPGPYIMEEITKWDHFASVRPENFICIPTD